VSVADGLGLVRALLSVPIAWLVIVGSNDYALALFVVAALTDALDGYLARRWSGLSPRGAFLDPVADKILIVVTLLALTLAGRGWPVTLVTILVGLREGVVTILRARALGRGISLSADGMAKAKTVLEMVGVALIILDGRPWAVAGTALVAIAFLVGIATLPRYLNPRLA